MNLIYHTVYMYNIIIYCTMLLYLEMKQMKEKQLEDLTSFSKRKEGIINTIANTVYVTYLLIVIYF